MTEQGKGAAALPDSDSAGSGSNGSSSAEDITVDEDFMCPICFELIKEAFVTVCGHSYCFQCISKHLENFPNCPTCHQPLTSSQIYPNYTLNKLLAKARSGFQARITGDQFIKQIQTSSINKWSIEDINDAVSVLTSKKRQIEKEKKEVEIDSVVEFLTMTVTQLESKELKNVECHLKMVQEDLKRMTERRNAIQETSESSTKRAKAIDGSTPGANEEDENRKKFIEQHLKNLQKAYYNLRDPDNHNDSEKPLSEFTVELKKIIQYKGFKTLATLKDSGCVASIEFNRDGDLFALGGITKKIKIYEYESLLDTKVDVRYPIKELGTDGVISCLSWNSYIKSYLASSDYSGAIALFDVVAGTLVKSFTEHVKRIWSIDFSRSDPTRLISGSDDWTVKIWATNQPKSIVTVDSPANVCCVRFSPFSPNLFAFGSADHSVSVYDTRQLKQPLVHITGHKKSVSYVRFISETELLTASTDSSLKLWDINDPIPCLTTYTGHINKRAFVGLATSSDSNDVSDYFVCGSENQAVYLYYKNISHPLLEHHLESTGDTPESVTSVAWRRNSKVVLAATNVGTIKALELI